MKRVVHLQATHAVARSISASVLSNAVLAPKTAVHPRRRHAADQIYTACRVVSAASTTMETTSVHQALSVSRPSLSTTPKMGRIMKRYTRMPAEDSCSRPHITQTYQTRSSWNTMDPRTHSPTRTVSPLDVLQVKALAPRSSQKLDPTARRSSGHAKNFHLLLLLKEAALLL